MYVHTYNTHCMDVYVYVYTGFIAECFLVQQQEKDLKRRELEDMPRRQSDRLAIKAALKEEEVGEDVRIHDHHTLRTYTVYICMCVCTYVCMCIYAGIRKVFGRGYMCTVEPLFSGHF